MKGLLLIIPTLLMILTGCATYVAERPAQTDDVIYEPAGAMNDPNPNWDINARDLHQRPYGARVLPWMPSMGTGIYTTTDTY